MIHCVKMYSSFDGKSFSTFGRIYSGTVRPGKLLSRAINPVLSGLYVMLIEM